MSHRGQLAQRYAACHAAANIEQGAGVFVQSIQLADNQIIEVIDVQHIAHLQSMAAKTHIGQRPAEQMTSKPQHDKAVIDLAHLPWA